jgi:hypothetical protein
MKDRALNFLFAAVLATCFSFALKQHHGTHQTKSVYNVYFVGKLPGTFVAKKEVTMATAIVVKDEAGNNYEVKRFKMFLKTHEGTQEIDAVGAHFTASQKKHLMNVLSGTEIVFDGIYIIGKSGREIKIDPASYTVK